MLFLLVQSGKEDQIQVRRDISKVHAVCSHQQLPKADRDLRSRESIAACADITTGTA